MRKNLQDTIDSLTPEELEMHKDLINECIERENYLLNQSKKTKEDLERLFCLMDNLIENLKYIGSVSEDVNNTLTLLSIPDDKFFNA